MGWLNSIYLQSFGYIGGWLTSGFFGIGDVRDTLATLVRGDVVNTFLNALAIIPLLGDGTKVVRVVAKYLEWLPDVRFALRAWIRQQFADAPDIVDDVIVVLIKQCTNSFSAETLVSTKDGLRPIADIESGELVEAWDADTGVTDLFTVTATMSHTDPTQVHLTIDGEVIETTPEHPFFTLEQGWVDAGDLWNGAHIRQASGSYGVVQVREFEHESQVMYNLTVAEAHTFFVGTQQWLVHNIDCDEFVKSLSNGATIIAELDKDDIFWLALEVPEALKGQGIGKQLFNEAWEALGRRATAIGGKWNTGMPDNLNSFNRYINEGKSEEEAALLTFTGRQAKVRGFTRVEFQQMEGTPGAYTNIEVVFRK